jgi:hypothetical protein
MSPLTPHAVEVRKGLDMGHLDVAETIAVPGMDASEATVSSFSTSNGVPGAGPTGARTRSQWSQSGVTDDPGLRHWEL